MLVAVLCRREDCGSKARGHGSGINWNMSASTCDDDNNRCPKPKDRCAQRDHCGDPPKVKREKKKRFVYFSVALFLEQRVSRRNTCPVARWF